MKRQEITLQTDTLEMTVKGQAPEVLDETQAAVLRLLHDGFTAEGAIKMLGDMAADALACLETYGVNPEAPIVLQAPGHVFHTPRLSPGERYLSGRLAQRAAHTPDAEALLLEQPEGDAIAVSVSDLSALVDEIAGRLVGEGLGPGDHIALGSMPSLEHTAICIAAWEAGVSVVILRPTLPAASIEIVARDIAPKIWFVSKRAGMPASARYVDPDAQAEMLDAWMDAGPSSPSRPKDDPDREAVVMTSSGSTGLPKLMALSHRGLYHSAQYCLTTDNLTSGNRISASIDMSAISGLRIFTALPALGPTSTFIPLPQTRDNTLAVLTALGQYDVVHARLVPANIRAIIPLGDARVSALGLETLKSIASGGSALHKDLRRRAAAMIGVKIFDHYGMTETSGSFCHTETGVMAQEGSPAHDILVRLVKEDGSACPPGEIGHIRFFDACLSLGEYKSSGFVPRAPGWFASNDMGRRGADSQIIVAGRSDAMMKTREGEFLAPATITNIVLTLKGVQDTVVFPDKDETDSDTYTLVIESQDPHDSVTAKAVNAISAHLGGFAVPKLVIVLPNFPRISQGKPDLLELKRIAKEA